MMSTDRRGTRAGNTHGSVLQNEMLERDLLAKTAVHELREPVQAVLSFLCVLLEERTGPLSDLQRDFLATANQATRRLSRRIDDLQLVMTDHQDLTIRPEPTDLTQRVTDCYHELAQIAESYSVRLEIDSDRLPERPVIWADPDRIDQILLNLIENAIQYSACNTTVRIEMRHELPDGWRVTVHNTIGEVLNEDPSQWFEPQTRGLHGLTSRRNGQGLGLAAAETLVRAQSGEISASVLGRTVSISTVFPAWRPSTTEHLNGHCTTVHEWNGIS